MEYKELLKENENLKEENLLLKKEINRLKSLLISKNISHQDKLESKASLINCDSIKDSGCVSKNSSMEEKIKLYKSLFKGREDVFAYRFEGKHGKRPGYVPSCNNEKNVAVCDKKNIRCNQCKNRSLKPLTDQEIRKHLSGTITIGMYPLLKGDLCSIFAIVFDDESWKQDVKAIYESFKKFDLSPSIEVSRSGQGAYLWIFFEEPILASKARRLGDLLMKYTIQHNFGTSLNSYDRFFPNQDKMPAGNFGNLIALPLQRIPAKEGYSLFVDENFNYYQDQWIYLSSVKKNILSKVIEAIKVLESELSENGEALLFKENIKVYSANNNIKKAVTPTDYTGKMELILSTGVIINTAELPRELLNEIKKLAAFSNPEYYKRQALRLYLGKTPRFIDSFYETVKYLVMPRGCREDIINLLEKYKIDYEEKDERISGEKIKVEFKGALYENQVKAFNEIVKYDTGILFGSTAFGKTVVALNIIAFRKVSTLIIVNSIELLEQWKTKLEVFLYIEGVKAGKIGGGRKEYSGVIDIATVQTLIKIDNLEEVLSSYGQVIIDECHHIAAFTFEAVLKKCKAKYILGLTATIRRKDGLEPIVEYQCGKVRYTDVCKNANESNLAYALIPRRVILNLDNYEGDKFKLSDYYDLIRKDANRNKLIFDDVMDSIKEGRNLLILTERLDHLQYLEGIFTEVFDRVIALKGGLGKKQREESMSKLKSFKDGENFILISTGKYIGEGFDDIRLDTLFLTMPISWEGTLKQYAGRLHRMGEGKEIVKIYDYVDENVPQLLRMYKKDKRVIRT